MWRTSLVEEEEVEVEEETCSPIGWDCLSRRSSQGTARCRPTAGAEGTILANLIELPNGCVCCTVKDTLIVMLERLLEMRTNIDYILLKSIFWLDRALDSRLRLDSVVCCINACNIGYQLECTSSSHHLSFHDTSS